MLKDDVNPSLQLPSLVQLSRDKSEGRGLGIGVGIPELRPIESIESLNAGLNNDTPDVEILLDHEVEVLCRIRPQQVLREGPEVVTIRLQR